MPHDEVDGRHEVKNVLVAVLLASFASACGGSATTSPSASTASASMAGAWVGIASDSSSSIGAGSMMGQADMGTMTWQLTENGSIETGPMTFSGSGMQGRTPGTLVGTMSGDDMSFAMDMPSSSMMSTGCSSRATGTAHVNRTTMTMTGTYSGSNSCSGAYTSGQMTMTRR